MFKPSRNLILSLSAWRGAVAVGDLPPTSVQAHWLLPGSMSNHWHLCPVLSFLPFPGFHIFLFLLIDHSLQECLNKEFREGKNFKAANIIILPSRDGQVWDLRGVIFTQYFEGIALLPYSSQGYFDLIPTPILFSLESFSIFSVFSTPEFLSVDFWFISVG